MIVSRPIIANSIAVMNVNSNSISYFADANNIFLKVLVFREVFIANE